MMINYEYYSILLDTFVIFRTQMIWSLAFYSEIYPFVVYHPIFVSQ